LLLGPGLNVGPLGEGEAAGGGAGGVVAVEHAWGGGGGAGGDGAVEDFDTAVVWADDFAEHFEGDAAGAQEGDVVGADIDDGGFDADFATVLGGFAAVEDEGDAAVEFGVDVRGAGGGDEAGAVGARGGDGAVEGAEEGVGDLVAGTADGDGGAAGGDEGADGGAAGQDESEGAGPEFFGEALGDGGEGGDAGAGGGEVGDVDDEGVGGRAVFGLVDFLDGVGAAGVGAEAVDGFGGEGDELALPQEFDRRQEAGNGGLDKGLNHGDHSSGKRKSEEVRG